MKKRIILLLMLAGLVLTGSGLSVCALAGSKPGPEDNSEADEIIQTVVDNLSLLAQVPRPSHHEEKISAFLKDWAEQKGFPVRQDEALNITFDIPASEGMEDYPLVALQGHMDMVVAVADGRDFDPLQDPITVIRNDETNTLTADGTSLGPITLYRGVGLLMSNPLRE